MTELYTYNQLVSLTQYPKPLFYAVYADLLKLYGGAITYQQLIQALNDRLQTVDVQDDNPRFQQPKATIPPKRYRYEESRQEIGEKLSQLDNPFAQILAQKFMNKTP